VFIRTSRQLKIKATQDQGYGFVKKDLPAAAVSFIAGQDSMVTQCKGSHIVFGVRFQLRLRLAFHFKFADRN